MVFLNAILILWILSQLNAPTWCFVLAGISLFFGIFGN